MEKERGVNELKYLSVEQEQFDDRVNCSNLIFETSYLERIFYLCRQVYIRDNRNLRIYEPDQKKR